jgi:phosphate transport system protein
MGFHSPGNRPNRIHARTRNWNALTLNEPARQNNVVAPKHILGTFDEALSDLRKDLLTMVGLTERSLYRAFNGLLRRDDDLCTKAIADDEEIDQLEKQIDKAGLEILFRYQPVASDLRQVISAMKLSPNIERVADEATNIAEYARELDRHPVLAEVNVIPPIQAYAISMFKDSIDAFVREDVALARAVVRRDKQLDEMNAAANRQLTERMMQDREQLRGYLNLILISRCLERVGDHATNIAEDAVYAAAAEDIRHQT